MVNINAICQYCFLPADKTKPVCPHCGNDPVRIPERSERCLPQNVILAGRYLIGRVLGEGGFGITYLALDLAAEKRVAVKEFFPDHLASRYRTSLKQNNLTVRTGDATFHFQKGLRSFRQEAETLQKFNRLPGIISVLDFFPENNTAYFVMNYIDGITLRQYLRRYTAENGHPLPYRSAIGLMRPVMMSLQLVHKAGIIHRDISPDNILVDQNGQVTLIDFGSARAERIVRQNLSVTVMVKHGYAPEEQYRTHGNQGAWTDIYAVCTTLYHMISGILPEDAIERLVQDQVVPLKKLPAGTTAVPVPAVYSDIIEKGMQTRAKDRYQTLDEMIAALDAADRKTGGQQRNSVSGFKVSVERNNKEKDGFLTSGRGDSRKRNATIAAVVLALVLFAAAGTMLFFYYSNQRSAVPNESTAVLSENVTDSSGQEENVDAASVSANVSPESGSSGSEQETGDDVVSGSSESSEVSAGSESSEVSTNGENSEASDSSGVSGSSEAGEISDSSRETAESDGSENSLRILLQPKDKYVYSTSTTKTYSAIFYVSAEGEELQYQWQQRKQGEQEWKNSSGDGSETPYLTLGIIGKGDDSKRRNEYRCVITDAYDNTVVSQSVKIAEKPVGKLLSAVLAGMEPEETYIGTDSWQSYVGDYEEYMVLTPPEGEEVSDYGVGAYIYLSGSGTFFYDYNYYYDGFVFDEIKEYWENAIRDDPNIQYSRLSSGEVSVTDENNFVHDVHFLVLYPKKGEETTIYLETFEERREDEENGTLVLDLSSFFDENTGDITTEQIKARLQEMYSYCTFYTEEDDPEKSEEDFEKWVRTQMNPGDGLISTAQNSWTILDFCEYTVARIPAGASVVYDGSENYGISYYDGSVSRSYDIDYYLDPEEAMEDYKDYVLPEPEWRYVTGNMVVSGGDGKDYDLEYIASVNDSQVLNIRTLHPVGQGNAGSEVGLKVDIHCSDGDLEQCEQIIRESYKDIYTYRNPANI